MIFEPDEVPLATDLRERQQGGWCSANPLVEAIWYSCWCICTTPASLPSCRSVSFLVSSSHSALGRSNEHHYHLLLNILLRFFWWNCTGQWRQLLQQLIFMLEGYGNSQCWVSWKNHAEWVTHTNNWNKVIKLHFLDFLLQGKAQKIFRGLTQRDLQTYTSVQNASQQVGGDLQFIGLIRPTRFLNLASEAILDKPWSLVSHMIYFLQSKHSVLTSSISLFLFFDSKRQQANVSLLP